MQKTSIQYNQDILERFIPVTIEDIIDDLLQQKTLSETEKSQFKQFCDLTIMLFNHQSINHLTTLKATYLPFNPDKDTISTKTYLPEDYLNLKNSLSTELDKLLNQANFEKLEKQDFLTALDESSPYGVEVSVDLDEFEMFNLYYRGIAHKTEYLRDWKKGFKKVKKVVPIYRRLFILLKPKLMQEQVKNLQQTKGFSEEKALKVAKKKISKLTTDEEGRQIFIKLFRDIPQHDLEMLLPNTKIKMRLFDKVKIGVTGGGGTVGGLLALITKMAVAVTLTAQLVLLGGFVGLLWRQVKNVFYQREKYSAQLSKNLYFYNIDNNLGAINYIVNMAQSEEVKEMVLSYYFLQTTQANNKKQLDETIENYINTQYAHKMDFEIDDGLKKLAQYQVIDETGETIQTLSLEKAVAQLKSCLLDNLKLNS